MTSEDEIINNINLLNFEKNEIDDFFGFEASKRKVFTIREQKRISDLDAKTKYAANRVFVNNGDSYHSKYIIQEINQVPLEAIEDINLENKLTAQTIFSETTEKQKSIIDNTSVEESQYNNFFSNIDNSFNSVSVGNDIRVLDEQYVKGNTNNNISVITSQPLIHSETVSSVFKKKPEIEPKKYDIVTTIKNKLHISDEKYSYLKHTKKIIIPSNKKSLIKEIQKCAVIVFDISLDKNEITEVNIILKKIIEEIDYIKNHPKSVIAKQSGIKVFILISSIQTWALTTLNENETSITQADYKHRICHPKYQAYYKIENYILQLNDKYRGYFHGIVLVSGLVYGHGEYMLKYIYETAFSDTEQLLIPKYYNNLPIIHVENLAKIITNLVMYYDKVTQPYIVGVETSRFGLRSITEAIKDEVHNTNYVYCDYNSLFLNSRVTQTIYDMVTMSIKIVPVIDDFITGFLSLDKTIPRIFTKTEEIISEYLNKNSKIINIIINGPHEITTFAKKLANTYNLKLIDPVTISEEFLNILENHVNNIDSNQTPVTYNIMNDNMISFPTFSMQHVTTNSEYNENNQSMFDYNALLEEQKKYFEDQGQISDKYLLPFIKNKISNNRGNKCGYIMSNFPQSIEEAQNIFNLEQIDFDKESIRHFFKNEIHPTIIIDVIMVGKNMINKVKFNSDMEQLQSDLNSKLLDDELDKLYKWFSLDSKYTENEVMKHILENDNIEIRKNRKLIDYLEVTLKPKMFKEYLLITENNLTSIYQEEFDNLFDSLLISMPTKIAVNEVENELSHIKSMINKMYDIHQTEFTKIISEQEEETYGKDLNQILDETKEEDHFPLKNIKIINFLMRCVNPILINGILEIMKNMPDDPIDFLVEYIYNHNMYNPCVSSPLNIKPKEANSLNQHLL